MKVTFESYIAELKLAWREDPAYELCIKFLTNLKSQPCQELAMLSYLEIARLIGKEKVDDDVKRVITFFVSSNFYILDIQYLFIQDEKEIAIPPEDFEETKRTNIFIHPQTGEKVREWQKYVFPYFVPSSNFHQIISQ